MNFENLKKKIESGESETVEFKESLDNSALECIAAFSNTNGGDLYIGVRDDGTVRGLTIGKETIQQWMNRIIQTTGVCPEFEEIDFLGKMILRINVSKNQSKLVSCKGRYLKRVGNSTRQMSEDDLTRAVLVKEGTTWDEAIESRAELSDLDMERFKSLCKLCSEKGRRLIPTDDTVSIVLTKLGLMKESQLTRACVLLFGLEPQRFYPEALIKVGRFRSETHIVDDREYQGCLFKQVEDVISYFRERLETHYEFTGEPVRNVIWEYPLEALREAVINAVCHRDYMINAHIQVRLYDDHLKFQNPGKLIPPLQIEELKREHLSYLRNRKIAEMLYYAGWIERWGSGTLKIYNACKNAGMPEPNFDEYSETFRLTLMKGRIIEDKIRYKNLNERQLSGMKYVNQKGHISTSEYQRINGVSRATSKRDLAELVNRNLLVSAGSGRASKYILAQAAQKRLINGSSGSENESEI